MAFRAHEEQQKGRERAVDYFITKDLSPEQRGKGLRVLYELMDELGPAIEYYPSWHPLISCGPEHSDGQPFTKPNPATGYEGLDHTRLFRNGFITCPRGGVEDVLSSVKRLRPHNVAEITAEALETPLYAPDAKPIVVRCKWSRAMENDSTIPKSVAAPLMLEEVLPGWWYSKRGETWETMRPYLLGRPRGSLSSLFVNQATGQVLKTIYNSLIFTGMYGPIKVDG